MAPRQITSCYRLAWSNWRHVITRCTSHSRYTRRRARDILTAGIKRIDTSVGVRAETEELRRFSAARRLPVIYYTTVLAAILSLRSCIRSLRPSACRIVVIVFLLQSWRASLIPLIAVPLSLICTFASESSLAFADNLRSRSVPPLASWLTRLGRGGKRGTNIGPRSVALEASEKGRNEVIGPSSRCGSCCARYCADGFRPRHHGTTFTAVRADHRCSPVNQRFNSLRLVARAQRQTAKPHHAEKDWVARAWIACSAGFFSCSIQGFERTTNGYTRTVGTVVRRSVIASGDICGIARADGVWFQKSGPHRLYSPQFRAI